MRWVLSALLLAHGVAHLPGFVSAWRLATLAEMPYHTTLLGGAVDVGDAGIRLVGAGWLLTAAGFGLAAAGALASRPGWVTLAMGVTAVSLVLCALEWPAARIGLAVDVALLTGLGLAMRLGCLAPGPTS